MNMVVLSLDLWPYVYVYAFGRCFYPKRLTGKAGRVRGSCLRTPTGGSTFHAGGNHTTMLSQSRMSWVLG